MRAPASDPGAPAGSGHHGPMARVPLRLRITLWVLAIFAVVHVSISAVVVLYHRERVHDQLREDLAMTAGAFRDQELDPAPTPS